jgi:hypothetical protein
MKMENILEYHNQYSDEVISMGKELNFISAGLLRLPEVKLLGD